MFSGVFGHRDFQSKGHLAWYFDKCHFYSMVPYNLDNCAYILECIGENSQLKIYFYEKVNEYRRIY
jgi:hypothetical protein